MERAEGTTRQRTIAGGLLLLLTLILAVLSVINTFVAADRAQEQAFALRESQYRACIVNGNTLREEVRDEFRDLKEPLISFFHQIAKYEPLPADILRTTEKAEARLIVRRATIDQRISDLNCTKIYPPLDDQTFPTVKRPTPSGGSKG